MPRPFTSFPRRRQPARHNPVSIHHPHDTTICQYDELTCRKDFEVPVAIVKWNAFPPYTALLFQFAKKTGNGLHFDACNYTMALPLPTQIDKMNSIHPMSDTLKLALYNTAKRKIVRAKDILLKPGEICDHLFFIEEGILSCYEKEGKKKYYTWLMFEGDIATSVDSFNNRVPSTEMIVAITDCILWTISWQENEDLTAGFPEYGFIRQKLTDHYHIQSRQIDAQRRRKPEQFYAFLVKTFPDIVRVPKITVASFMGITEQTLYSKLKKKKKVK
jgi:CRP/FNR family transcriptional regulator, anaerobic regulatory protein